MTGEEKIKLKDKIIILIEELKKAIEDFKEASKPVALDNPIGRLTRMDAIGSKNISQASLRNAKARLERLEFTLKKIDKPEFGMCINCEKEIPFKRLLLVPETDRCVNCAE